MDYLKKLEKNLKMLKEEEAELREWIEEERTTTFKCERDLEADLEYNLEFQESTRKDIEDTKNGMHPRPAKFNTIPPFSYIVNQTSSINNNSK